MQRLIILLAAALLALTLACEAAGELSNAIRDEVGGARETTEDAGEAVQDAGNAIRDEVGSAREATGDAGEAVQDAGNGIRSESGGSGGNAVPAERILAEYLDDELQATADWRGERVLVTVPRIDECTPYVGWAECSVAVEELKEPGYSPPVFRFSFKDVDDAVVFRNTLQASCVVSWVHTRSAPLVSFEDCR